MTPDTTKAREERIEPMFPIMGGPNIPWALIAPFEYQAKENHSQTLKRLAERGGLDMGEALAVMTGKKWRDIEQPTLDKFRAFIRLREVEATEQAAKLAAIRAAAQPRAEVPPKLRELSQKATPGEWTVKEYEETSPHGARWEPTHGTIPELCQRGPAGSDVNLPLEDARFIVASVNFVRSLSDATPQPRAADGGRASKPYWKVVDEYGVAERAVATAATSSREIFDKAIALRDEKRGTLLGYASATPTPPPSPLKEGAGVDLVPGLREALRILRHPNAGMVPPDGGDPSQTDRVRNVADEIKALATARQHGTDPGRDAPSSETREAVLEEAEQIARKMFDTLPFDQSWGARKVADAIAERRALKRPRPDPQATQADGAGQPDAVGEVEKRGTIQGMLIACTTAVRSCQREEVAEQIIREAGITEAEILASGLEDFDTEIALPIARRIRDEDREEEEPADPQPTTAQAQDDGDRS